jgi:4a-hydroxytetrahydrobiopterin dehydratase
MSDSTVLTEQQVADEQLVAWQYDVAGGGSLGATFDTGDFATGLRLTNRIGELAEVEDHHPDLTLTYPTLAVRLTSHDVGGVTARDVRMARSISEHAAAEKVGPARA